MQHHTSQGILDELKSVESSVAENFMSSQLNNGHCLLPVKLSR